MASSSAKFMVTSEEFNAFHKIDRTLFAFLVLNLRRDINQSFQVMSFLLYLEKSVFMSNLIAKLVSCPEFFINSVVDEVVLCLSCLYYEDFAAFVTNSRQNIKSLTLPFITRMMTGVQLTLPVIHGNRENILIEMKKHLTRICNPTFKDICLHVEIYNKEKVIEKMSQLGINMVQNISEQQENVKDEQVMAEDRTVFLTFSRGYPISEAEVHAYFTRKFGDIIEAIHMPEVEENEQALYAKMVLYSASKIQEIVSGENSKNKFTINGKHVKVRRYIPKPSNGTNNLPLSIGVSL
ncbi:unnamed protein product [Cochlearia groenlandica]